MTTLTPLAAVLVFFATMQPQPAQPQRSVPPDVDDPVINVFYCTHSAGYQHEVLPLTREIMAGLSESQPWLNVIVSNDIADLTPELLGTLDVVMFYTTGELPMTQEQKDAFVRFCADGGGFVGVHSATDTFYQWPWYVNLVGGSFNGHPWHENVGILCEHTGHPTTEPLGCPRFEITDEIYTFKDEATDREILLRLDNATTRDADPEATYALAWTRDAADGRVFYTALGHRPEVWQDDRFIQHLLAGIRWAAEGDR